MSFEYYQISAQDLGKDAKVPILKLGDSGEVFYELALEMLNCIKANNAAGKKTVFICPVGPVGQYPIFVRLVNRERVSLKNWIWATSCPSAASWSVPSTARLIRNWSSRRSSGCSRIRRLWSTFPA